VTCAVEMNRSGRVVPMIPFGKRYEVLDGELFVSPAPTREHQRAVRMATSRSLAGAREPARILRRRARLTRLHPSAANFSLRLDLHQILISDQVRLHQGVRRLNPGKALSMRTRHRLPDRHPLHEHPRPHHVT